MPKREPASPAAAAPAKDAEPPRGPSWPPRLVVDVVVDADGWDAVGCVGAMIAPLLDHVSVHPVLSAHLSAQACLALVDDAAMRQLNATYRAQDKPTNVLSFPAGFPGLPESGELRQLGDIALALDTVQREARDLGLDLPDHIRHLVLHGLLHLMGYDHETDADADVMEALEIEILALLGIASPYTEAAMMPAQA
jgi:probable rRNA maturation factor